MLSDRTATIEELIKRTQKLLAVLEKHILTKPSRESDYKEIVVPGNPSQTFLRGWWCILRHFESFQKSIHKHPSMAGIKLLRIAPHIKAIHELFKTSLYQNAGYVMMTSAPTLKEITALPIAADAVYVRVRTENNEDKLFYVDKQTKECRELQLVAGITTTSLNKLCAFRPEKIGRVIDIDKGYFDTIRALTEHVLPVVLDKNVYEFLKAAYENLEWMLVKPQEQHYHFSEEHIGLLIERFKKAIPFDKVLSLLRPFLDVAEDFTVERYLSVENKNPNSLNAELYCFYLFARKKIKAYEMMHPSLALTTPRFFKEVEEKPNEVQSRVGVTVSLSEGRE